MHASRLFRPSVVAAAALFLSAIACGSGEEEEAAAPAGGNATAVKIVTVGLEPLERATTTFGSIEAVQTAELRPEATGAVSKVNFEDGQTVKKGALLVKLRDDGARAQLADAEARVALAEAQHGRVSTLFDKQNTSRMELDQATAQRDLARAAVDLAKDSVRRTEVRAPFDGTLGRREISVGASVGPTTPVTRIEDLAIVTVDLALPERLLATVTVGSPVRVRVDAYPDEQFPGEVRYVAPRVDQATRTFEVRASVDNGDGRLRPGLSAEVEVVTSAQSEAVLVPTQAVSSTDQGATVFIVDADGKAQIRPVKAGARMDDRIEILEGLAAGDRVITEGLSRLAPGAVVRIVDEAAAAGAPAR